MAILFGSVAGILLMLTVTGIINAYHIAVGLIIVLAIISIEPIAKFWNWRMEK